MCDSRKELKIFNTKQQNFQNEWKGFNPLLILMNTLSKIISRNLRSKSKTTSELYFLIGNYPTSSFPIEDFPAYLHLCVPSMFVSDLKFLVYTTFITDNKYISVEHILLSSCCSGKYVLPNTAPN